MGHYQIFIYSPPSSISRCCFSRFLQLHPSSFVSLSTLLFHVFLRGSPFLLLLGLRSHGGRSKELKQLVVPRLRGRRKRRGLINDNSRQDNSLHVKMRQTECLATVAFEIITRKPLIWGLWRT